jgi:hypothetical protein
MLCLQTEPNAACMADCAHCQLFFSLSFSGMGMLGGDGGWGGAGAHCFLCI